MNAKKLSCLFLAILFLWLAARLGDDYQMRRCCAIITQLSSKFPEFKDVRASREKPGLISVFGLLESRKDFGKLVMEVQKIMDRQLIFRPQISFAVEFDKDGGESG